MADVAEYKKKIVEDLIKLMRQYSIIGIVNMENLPAPQLQSMRSDLRGKINLFMTKKRFMKIAIEKIKTEMLVIPVCNDTNIHKHPGISALIGFSRFVKNQFFVLASRKFFKINFSRASPSIPFTRSAYLPESFIPIRVATNGSTSYTSSLQTLLTAVSNLPKASASPSFSPIRIHCFKRSMTG